MRTWPTTLSARRRIVSRSCYKEISFIETKEEWHDRSGTGQLFSEFVATFGLLSVIWGCSRLRTSVVPFAVGAYITAAYWFTASTSFANPAVTLAWAASDPFSGIRPADVPGFIAAQLIGGRCNRTV